MSWLGCSTRTAKQWSGVFAPKWSAVMRQQLSIWKHICSCPSFSKLWAFNIYNRWEKKGQLGFRTLKQHWIPMQKFVLKKIEISVIALYSKLWPLCLPGFKLWWSDSCQNTHRKIGSCNTHFKILLTCIVVMLVLITDSLFPPSCVYQCVCV